MRTSPLVAYCSVAALLSIASPSFAQSTPQFGIAGIAIEGVLLQRDQLGDFALTKANDRNGSLPGGSGPGLFAPVSYNELDPDLASGMRLRLDGWLFGQRTIYSILGAWGFDDAQDVIMPPFARFGTDAAYELPGADVDLANSDIIEALRLKFTSYLVSTDSASFITGGSPDRPGFHFIAGTRTIILDEKLDVTAYDNLNSFNGVDNDTDRTRIDLINLATGLQIGVDGYAALAPGLTLGGFIKGGLLANFIDIDSRFSSDDNAANVLNKSYDSVEFAQFVELSARLSYDLEENLRLTASGMLLHINGIAEAGGQFSSVADNEARGVNADSDALFYGGTLGVSIKLN